MCCIASYSEGMRICTASAPSAPAAAGANIPGFCVIIIASALLILSEISYRNSRQVQGHRCNVGFKIVNLDNDYFDQCNLNCVTFVKIFIKRAMTTYVVHNDKR